MLAAVTMLFSTSYSDVGRSAGMVSVAAPVAMQPKREAELLQAARCLFATVQGRPLLLMSTHVRTTSDAP
jgi:hypothetical protein